MKIELFFRELYGFLDVMGYSWLPLIPERLLNCRKQPENYSLIERKFGLGLSLSTFERGNMSIPEALVQSSDSMRLGMSRIGNYYTPFNHWPSLSDDSDHFVHLGQESILLLYQLHRYWDLFMGRKVLDLGCGGGLISTHLSEIASEVIGIDRSPRAIEWAMASGHAQRCHSVQFQHFEIQPDSELHFSHREVDFTVFNPPMGVSHPHHSLPHRDGGRLGMEIPLLFLDYSRKVLKPQGEVFCLMTNPIRGGISLLFQALQKRDWRVMEKVCINREFNHVFLQEDYYRENGIESIELYFLRLRSQYYL